MRKRIGLRESINLVICAMVMINRSEEAEAPRIAPKSTGTGVTESRASFARLSKARRHEGLFGSSKKLSFCRI